MSDYFKQHTVPACYLREFIDLNRNSSEVHFVNFKHAKANKLKIESKGPNSKIFWKANYYSQNNNLDRHIIEKKYLSFYENDYHSLIKRLKQKILDNKSKALIIKWIIHSKERNPAYRNAATNHFREYIKPLDEIEGEENKQLALKMIELTSSMAKLNQIESIAGLNNSVNRNEFAKFLWGRKWELLVAPEEYPFISNDDPGFIFEHDQDYLPAENRFISSSLFQNNEKALCYVFTPIYCIRNRPVYEHDIQRNELSCWEEFLKEEIEIIKLDREQIKKINIGVFKTKGKLIISNSKDALQEILNEKY